MPALKYVEIRYRSSDGTIPEAVAELLMQHDIAKVPRGHRVRGEKEVYRTTVPLYEPGASQVAEACGGLDEVVDTNIKKEREVSHFDQWSAVIGTSDLGALRKRKRGKK